MSRLNEQKKNKKVEMKIKIVIIDGRRLKSLTVIFGMRISGIA